MTKNSLEGQKSMESDDYYVYLQAKTCQTGLVGK